MLINVRKRTVQDRSIQKRRLAEAGLENCENELRTHYVVVRGTVA